MGIGGEQVDLTCLLPFYYIHEADANVSSYTSPCGAMIMTALIVNLLQATQPSKVGGKAAALCALARNNLPVPPAFCVTVAGLRAIDSRKMEVALAEALEELAVPFVAVRSSAVDEDRSLSSFAGVYRTSLNVPATTQTIMAALKRVKASLDSVADVAYRARRQILVDPQMAAVVQAMIAPTASGVLFTRNPVTGEVEFIIEASWGLGESVVSGHVTPDRFVLDREGKVQTADIAQKDLMIVSGAEGTATVAVKPELRNMACLNDEELEQLVKLGTQCEAIFHQPQDVEWALVNGDLWILQSRPITQ
jgi:phosphoenolpyruvate synthase/pyruvate phosphate dikinase